MFGIKPKTLHYWYKEEFSGYPQQVKAGAWGEKKITVVDEHTGEVLKEKPVPIAKMANMGSHMTIDEKQIGKRMYTIMTNAGNGKIALLAESMKPEELKQAIGNYLSEKVKEVKSISCDMSPSYKKLCREVFTDARLVIDKFHVIKHLMDALQQVRRQLKSQCLTDNKSINSQPAGGSAEEEVYTQAEMLERSRYTLCKMEAEWLEDEKEIMEQLFSRYPVLKTAYELTQQLRNWYHGRNIGKSINTLENELHHWCMRVNESKITAFKAIRKMIEKHWDDIINYFLEGQTNAKAENMNGKIQRFLANNFGIKDRDFFLFRVAGYFS